jgi:predicted ABC-type ATPase
MASSEFELHSVCHILLNHSLCQLRQMKGFHDIGEDRIESSHQDRMQNEARLMQLRNKGLKMDSQAKFQGLKLIKEIQYI